MLAACGGSTQDSAVPSTRTLVPPTLTATFEPSPAVPTPTDLPAPASLVPQPTAINTSTLPPAAQDVLDRSLDDLARRPGVNSARVRLLGLDAFTWPDAALGCPAQVDPGLTVPDPVPGWRVMLLAGSRIYVYHAAEGGEPVLCEDERWLAQEGKPLAVDPIAESMIAQTRRDAATRLGVPGDQLRLASVLAIVWPDASVGCPKPDGVYDSSSTPGYRIVYRAGGNQLIYHTSVRDSVFCQPEEEILPGALRRAVAAVADENR